MKDDKIDKELFRDDAKGLVDTIFDKKLFVDSITRQHMKIFEDIINMSLYYKYKSYILGQEFLDQIKPKKDASN